jgi:hypothetical protein
MMARFSKQYCEMYHPNFNWDFDIEREAASFEEGDWTIDHCDGFGSSAFGLIDGKVCLAFVDLERVGSLQWVPLDKVTNMTKTELFVVA